MKRGATGRGNVGWPLRGGLVGLVLGASLIIGALPVAAVGFPNSLRGLEATYDVDATLTWGARRLDVTSTATVKNNSGSAVGALTFNAAPAKIGQMVLGAVAAGGKAAATTVDDQNILVTLPSALEPSQQTAVTISYSAWFGTTGNKQFLFAKVNGIATAYRWIPWLSRAYPFRTPTYGEPFVTKTASDVTVSITTDRAMGIATTGRQTGGSGLTRNFVAHNVRDFNFAASPKYVTATQRWGDVTIRYFVVMLPLTKIKKWTVAALTRFSDRVGPYPYNDYVVAEVPTGPSMESPGMIWLTQRSLARGNLKYLTVHETAHQWFYGVLGNDQASEPFADEALAEFLTRDMIGHRASNCAQDKLDKSVYSYSKACYYETIYVQGDNYINAYRQRVGDAAFWAGIRDYYVGFKFGLGGTRALLDTLDAAAGGAGGGHEGRFPSLYP